MTSLGCQFDFHDVILHVQHCNVNNRRVTSVLQLMDIQTINKITRFSQTRVNGNSKVLFKMAELLYTLKDLLIFFNLVRIKIKSR